MSEWATGVVTAAEIVETEQAYEVWTQERRAEALMAARRALVNTTFAGTGKADAVDLVALAKWVMTGIDPYEPEVVVPDRLKPKMAWVEGRGIVEVEDSQLPDALGLFDQSEYPDADRDGPNYRTSEGDEGR